MRVLKWCLRDEFSKRCDCRTHFRWTQHGKQHRRKADTRSWTEAEDQKRRLEDQLAGRTPEAKPDGRDIQSAITVFLQDKKNQAITDKVIGKYSRASSPPRVRRAQQGPHGPRNLTGIAHRLLCDVAGGVPIHPHPSQGPRACAVLPSILL